MVDYCLSQPCQNDGSCDNLIDTFNCTCPASFFGNKRQRHGYGNSFILIEHKDSFEIPFPQILIFYLHNVLYRIAIS